MPVIITVVSTVSVFSLAEYVFHIPSRFFETNTESIADNDSSWTPRPIPIVVQPNPVATGTLEEKPTVCTMEFSPVCGADKHDYSNSCVAIAAWTTVAYAGNCIKENAITDTWSLASVVPTVVSGERDLSLYESGAYHIYENKSFGYKLALPKYAYYQGYGKSDPSNTYGADHILAVSLSSTGAESLELTEVQVIILKTNPNLVLDGKAVDLANWSRVYVIAPDVSNPKIQKIVDTVVASVQ
jgi:hypothetical protein